MSKLILEQTGKFKTRKSFDKEFKRLTGIKFDKWKESATDYSTGEIYEQTDGKITVGCSAYDGILKVFRKNK
jgi:hypothetical protein